MRCIWPCEGRIGKLVQIPTTPAEIIPFIMAVITSHTFIEIIIFPGFIHLTLITAFLTWYERKLLARIQLRIGPVIRWGPRRNPPANSRRRQVDFQGGNVALQSRQCSLPYGPTRSRFPGSLTVCRNSIRSELGDSEPRCGISVRLRKYLDFSAHDNHFRMGQQQQVSFPQEGCVHYSSRWYMRFQCGFLRSA